MSNDEDRFATDEEVLAIAARNSVRWKEALDLLAREDGSEETNGLESDDSQ